MKIQTMGYLLELKTSTYNKYYNCVCVACVCVAWQEMIAPE